jgi:hypothetical protein
MSDPWTEASSNDKYHERSYTLGRYDKKNGNEVKPSEGLVQDLALLGATALAATSLGVLSLRKRMLS